MNEFVRANLATYGLLGTNNRPPADAPWPPLAPPAWELTRDNHHRFGFDGVAFNRRPSLSSTYWVEFGRPARGHRGVREEVREALVEVVGRHGPVTLSWNGSTVAAVVAAVAEGLPVEGIALDIEGHGAPRMDAPVPTRRHAVRWDELVDFALTVAAEDGCSNAYQALDAFHGTLSPRPHVYTNGALAAVQHAFDREANCLCGPSTWAVASREQATWIHRWLAGANRPGVPHLLLWSPELIAAFVDAPRWREAITTDCAQATLAQATLRAAYPEVPARRFAARYRRGQELQRKLDGLSRRMRHLLRGRTATHYIPDPRFLAQLGVVP